MDSTPSSLRLTANEIRAWRIKCDLTQVQFARLVWSAIIPASGTRGNISTRIQKWESGQVRIPAAEAELLLTKLLLLSRGIVTYEELLATPLPELLCQYKVIRKLRRNSL